MGEEEDEKLQLSYMLPKNSYSAQTKHDAHGRCSLGQETPVAPAPKPQHTRFNYRRLNGHSSCKSGRNEPQSAETARSVRRSSCLPVVLLPCHSSKASGVTLDLSLSA